MDTLRDKLEAAIGHSLWDVALEYRLLPFPLCSAVDQAESLDNTISQSLPCSEPTTPVRCKKKKKFIF